MQLKFNRPLVPAASAAPAPAAAAATPSPALKQVFQRLAAAGSTMSKAA